MGGDRRGWGRNLWAIAAASLENSVFWKEAGCNILIQNFKNLCKKILD